METKKVLSQFEFKNALFGYGVQMQALSQCPTSKDIHDEAERLQSQLLEDNQLQRDRLAALEAERDEARDTHAASMVTWNNTHTQQFMEIGELKRQIDEWAKTAETLRHERDEARAASQQNYDNWQESRAYHFSATEELAALRLRLEGAERLMCALLSAPTGESVAPILTEIAGFSDKTKCVALEAAKETA